MRAICVVILAVFSLSAAAPKPKPVTSKPLSAIEIGQQRVARALRDPESARFSESFSSASNAICGLVNAKNAMGGYSGSRRFISTPDRVMVESESGGAAFDYRWLELCEEGAIGSGEKGATAR